jgi:xylulose-5-phosphate/fructose-6-phosphate phosphoketolase
MHPLMADALETALDAIRSIQTAVRADGRPVKRPIWPMIVLRSPKGWTGPKEVDGKKVEGFWRAHQVPIADPESNPAHLAILEE